MPHNYFYHPYPLKEKETITLSANEAKHARVMRLQKNDLCYLINGKGAKASAYVNKVEKDVVVITDKIEKKSETAYPLHMALAYMKKSHLEFAIEKCTELGVRAITLFKADFSEKKEISKVVQERLDNIMISALKQSGNLFLPTLSVAPSLSSVMCKQMHVFYGKGARAPFFTMKKAASTLFFVGPEKGFSGKEEELLEKKYQAKGVSLSKNILRTETAAITAAALGSYLLDSLPE